MLVNARNRDYFEVKYKNINKKIYYQYILLWMDNIYFKVF